MSGEHTTRSLEVLLCPSPHTLAGPCREILFEAQGQRVLLTLPGWFRGFLAKTTKKRPRFFSFQEQFLVQLTLRG